MRNSLLLVLLGSCALSGCGGGSSQQSVPPLPLAIGTASLPNGASEIPYSQTIQASGGVGPFAWTVSSGALPQNLTLGSSETNMATISGTPDAAVRAAGFTIEVTDSANQSATQPYTVSIVVEPDTLTFSPASLSFLPPRQLIGSMSAAQTETLTNTGTLEVVISNIALTGTNAADFSQSNTCGSSLAAGANCPVNVTFTPSQLGPRSASITITDSTAGSPDSVSVSGVGLTSGPNATLSATSLAFGGQHTVTTSAAQSITLSNYGTATLNIASIAASADFGQTNTCNSALLSGASCTVSVTFTPGTSGSLNGTLSFADSAADSPQMVSLSGILVPARAGARQQDSGAPHNTPPVALD
ncbi:MAG: choice-of-anchor D domain-containing protein [Candidatus Sulfotelmatobacter sp.]